MEQLRQFLHDNPSYHLFGVAETWLGAEVSDDVIQIDGFNVLRQDRNVHGGGVALYVRNTFRVTRLACSNTERDGKPGVPEFLMCSVEHGQSSPVFVSVIYRPPHVPFLRQPELMDNLRVFCGDYSHKIIMGDLNADFLSESDDAKLVRKLMAELSLQLVQHGATHHTATSHTWIDAILLDDNDDPYDARNEAPPFRSKHNIIDVTLNVQAPAHSSESFYYRDFKNIEQDSLLEFLQSCDWSVLNRPDSDVEGKVDQLGANLEKAINKLAPEKQFTPRKGALPWVDAELKLLYQKRDSTYKRYCRTKNERFLEEFRALRQLAESRTNQARIAFYQNRLYGALGTNNIWKELRSLGLLPKFKGGSHGFSPEDLNTHFASISVSDAENTNDIQDVLSSACEDGFTFKPVLLADVILAIAHFSSQARGEDGIPHSVVVKALPFIGNYLVDIFNSSLSKGIFPETWKRAHVLPLKKSVSPTSPSDFRPIAILCFLSKVFEKIVHSQISDYLSVNGVLDALQTGFRQHHSTQTALLKLTDDIRSGIDKKLLTVLLLFDFSKAFDTISPTRLLRRLSAMGFSRSALLWLSSYLVGRKQLVVSSRDKSPWVSTNLGVPQGSVLGPLLFCLYINDLRDVLDCERVKHILYADDLQIYVQVPKANLDEGITILAESARAVSDWAASAALRLNAGKTKAIIFGASRYLSDLDKAGLPSVGLEGGISIPFSDTVTSLGVILDSRLTWKPQVDAIIKSCNKVLYSLRFFRAYTSEALRERLVKALVFPRLDYCSVVCLDASLEQRTRLQVMQNSCVRYVMGVRGDVHISPFRSKLGWLKVDSRRNYFAAILMYKIRRLNVPDYLTALFSTNQNKGPARGNVKELSIPWMRTDTGKASFQVQAAHLWNAIPDHIRNVASLHVFKKAVWRHLSDLD